MLSDTVAEAPVAGALVYVIDSDPVRRAGLGAMLAADGYGVAACGDAGEFLRRYRPEPLSCLVLHTRATGSSVMDVQSELRARGIRLPLLLIADYSDFRLAVQAMKARAFDFLEDPLDPVRLRVSVREALAWDLAARRRQAEIDERHARLTAEWQALSAEADEFLSRIAR